MDSIETFLLAHPHIHIHDDKRAHVKQLIRSLIDDGRQRLHVVADFDFTMTIYEKDGQRSASTFGVVESNDRIKVRRDT
jgi:hypothetical protein